MWAHWRNRSEHWLASGGYLLLLGLGTKLESNRAWTVIAAVVSGMALLAWRSAARRRHAIDDTPTSRIASAAQGRVELQGRGRPLQGQPWLHAPLDQQPCLWFRYRIEERNNKGWDVIEQGESDEAFLLDDGSGVCVVELEGAEISPWHSHTWTSGNHRYTQAVLLGNDLLYVLGEFRSTSGVDLALSLRSDLSRRLSEWKADMPALLQGHDHNGDGTLDPTEWEAVRQKAVQAVQAEHQALRATPQTHRISVPSSGEPFLISAIQPEQLQRQLRWWSYAHIAVFMGALAWLGMGLKAWPAG